MTSFTIHRDTDSAYHASIKYREISQYFRHGVNRWERIVESFGTITNTDWRKIEFHCDSRILVR